MLMVEDSKKAKASDEVKQTGAANEIDGPRKAKSKTLINWEAREYIEHKKTVGWYVGLAVVTVALLVLAVALKYWSFVAVIIAAAAALLFYVSRPPRMLHYSLSDDGVTEGNTLQTFDKFRAFGVLNEDNHYSIVLIPKKRLGTRTIIYFPETEGEQIVDVFGEHLPMEEVHLDAIDRLVRILKI